MKIDGKAIAESILSGLTQQVTELKKRSITPTMAVILVGDNPASLAYIKQKEKAAERIGAKLVLSHQLSAISCQQLQQIIEQYNTDPNIHGIIIQRPLPKPLNDSSTVLHSAIPDKDIDGFVPGSPFEVPVASAVMTIMNFIRSHLANAKVRPLEDQHIVIIGRGETGGKPIADLLDKHKCNVTVIHSQTLNPDKITRSADIIISCVGKGDVVRRDNIRKDAILLSVGIWRDSAGKLHGDYNEEEISDIAGFYTPTPGGVGPVNVACLMQNLILAAHKTH